MKNGLHCPLVFSRGLLSYLSFHLRNAKAWQAQGSPEIPRYGPDRATAAENPSRILRVPKWLSEIPAQHLCQPLPSRAHSLRTRDHRAGQWFVQVAQLYRLLWMAGIYSLIPLWTRAEFFHIKFIHLVLHCGLWAILHTKFQSMVPDVIDQVSANYGPEGPNLVSHLFF